MSLLASPAPLPAAHEATFTAAAARWSGGAYDMAAYDTPGAALDAYAAFHAASLRGAAPAKSLVFVPNQYGLGNRLRAMKASLLVAMLTGRTFHVRWADPLPLEAAVRPERIDWRESSQPAAAAAGSRGVLCLPFATHTLDAHARKCGQGLADLQRSDLRAQYGTVDSLEVHTFTDLNIYLSQNPHYAPLLSRMAPTCPKRMGCLYAFLLSPQPIVQARLDALLRPGGGGGGGGGASGHVGVQVRNRLWRLEALKAKASKAAPAGATPAGAPRDAATIVACLARFVPPAARVFFTADDDTFYPVARAQFGTRMVAEEGGVYAAWSQGSKTRLAGVGEPEAASLLKAFVDWFALRVSDRIVYTHQSSFGKTAAEASDAPNLDLNHSRCDGAVADGLDWSTLPEDAWQVTYDTRRVPGAVDFEDPRRRPAPRRDEL